MLTRRTTPLVSVISGLLPPACKARLTLYQSPMLPDIGRQTGLRRCTGTFVYILGSSTRSIFT